jgi:hypothetical protein
MEIPEVLEQFPVSIFQVILDSLKIIAFIHDRRPTTAESFVSTSVDVYSARDRATYSKTENDLFELKRSRTDFVTKTRTQKPSQLQ